MDVPSSSSHVGEEHEGERGGRNRGHSSSCTDSSTTMCPLSSRVSDAHSCVSSGLAFPSHRITEWTRRLLGIQKHFFSSLYRLEHALMERTRCLHELRQLIPPIRTTMSEACVEGTYPSRLPLSSEAAKAVPSIPTHTPAARGFTRTAPLSTQILLPAPPLDLLLCSLARPEEDSDSEEEEDEEEEKEGKRGEDEKSKEMVNTYRCSGTKAPSLYALYRGGLYYSAGIPSRVRRRWMYLSVLGTAVKNALLTPATESEMERSVWRCSKGREESRGSEVGGRLRVNRPTVDSHSFPSFPSSVLPTPPCSQAQDEDHTAFPLSFFLHTSPYAFTPMPPLYVPTPATNSSLKTKTIPADMVHRSTSFWCTECRWMEGLNADTSMPIPTSPTGLHHHTKYKREKEVLFAPLPAQAEEGHRSEEEVRSSSSATVRKQWERPTTEHFTSFSGSFSSFVSSSSLTHFFRSCAWNRSSTDRVVQSILEDRRASSTSEGGAECASKEEEMNNTGIPLQDLRQRFAATHCRETLANTWKRMSRQALLWNAAQRGSASGFSSSSTSATATRRTAPSALSSRHCGSTPKPVDVPPFSWRLFFHDQDLFISRNMRDHYSLHGALLASLLEQRDQQALVSSTISLPSSCCHSPSLAVYSRDMEKRKHHHETEQKNTLFHCFPLYSTFRVPRWNVWLTREMESRTGRVTEKKKTYDASREEDTDRDGDLFRSEKAGDRTSAAGSDVAVFRPAPPCLMEGGVEWKDFCRVSLRNLKGKGEHPTCIDARDENLSFATSAFLELQRLQVLRNKLEFIASENGRRSGSQTSASCTLHRITPRNNIHHPLKRGASDPLWESLERKCCTQEDRGLAAVGTLQRVYGLRLILRDSNSRREETTSSSFGC